jgi:trehalose/maltose transport system permease protein
MTGGKPAGAAVEGSVNSLERKDTRLAWTLLAPSLLIVALIAFYPLGMVFYNSFTNKGFATNTKVSYVGLANYKRLLGLEIVPLPGGEDQTRGLAAQERLSQGFRLVGIAHFFGSNIAIGGSDPDFISAVSDTISFTAVSVFLETILGMIVALVLVSNFPGRGAVRMSMLIPWAIPTAVSSKMWAWMFSSTRAGVVNVFCQALGITDGQFSFLTTASTQLWAMIAIDVWKTTPFMALLLMAGLQMIPRELYEASKVDGCGSFRQFWKITLPLIKSSLAVALVFRTLDALRVFDLFQIIFAQQRYSMASFAYYQLIDNRKMGYSSAASVVIFLIISIFILIYGRLSGGSDERK